MSWNLFVGTMKQRGTALFWYAFTLVLYSWVMVWYWPLMGDSYSELVDTLPPEMLQAFAGGEVDLGTLGGFFQVEYLGLMWMGIVASAVILFASKAIATEISTGTMELLLAQPISRVRFALTRIATLVVFVGVLSAATFVPIVVFGPSYDIELSAKAFWLLLASGSLFMLAVGGIAFMLSAVMRDGGKPAAITGGLFGAMWVLHAMAALADFADKLEPLNLVKYWQPAQLINDGTVAPELWWVYGGIALVTLGASVVLFSRRDLA